VEFLIDSEGAAEKPRNGVGATAAAVWDLGLIRIEVLSEFTIIVSLRPDLVNARTMVGAFYTIADLCPARIFVRTDPAAPCGQAFQNVASALRKIEQLRPNASQPLPRSSDQGDAGDGVGSTSSRRGSAPTERSRCYLAQIGSGRQTC
jgi:hypothetical protein